MLITNCYTQNMGQITPFGAALRFYRKKEKHLTQEKLASKLNISQAMISRLELGIDNGSSETRDAILNYFKIPYEEFIETGRKHAQPQITPLSGEDIRELIQGEISRFAESKDDLKAHLYKKNKNHHNLIDTFEQIEEAYEINCILKQIETLKKTKFKRIKKFLLDELNELQEEKGPSRTAALGEEKIQNGTDN